MFHTDSPQAAHYYGRRETEETQPWGTDTRTATGMTITITITVTRAVRTRRCPRPSTPLCPTRP
ncbi:hypothetical protein GCM10023084_27910 [Streptomyces lacrimifluminis]|uniref:Uncharacterized protein n=1 Tax=Streptomyces lacrimifluminis TaxID=1500077 RepID=A0A917KSB2_9ACTN|nr:hypothetical protein GCM10012282_24530 [Streptomyces lacrimifluminis]